MPLKLKRREGSVTPFRNAEYIHFYYLMLDEKKNAKTQRIVIFYRFVGYIEIPESAFTRRTQGKVWQFRIYQGKLQHNKKGAGNPAPIHRKY